jgi:hypothetical protein
MLSFKSDHHVVVVVVVVVVVLRSWGPSKQLFKVEEDVWATSHGGFGKCNLCFSFKDQQTSHEGASIFS